MVPSVTVNRLPASAVDLTVGKRGPEGADPTIPPTEPGPLMESAVQAGPIEPDDEDARAALEENIKRELARELHDSVAQTLTTMLIEMENFKLEQFGRQSVLTQVSSLQDSTRDVLSSLRQLLYNLRGEPTVEDGFVETVQALLRSFQSRTGIVARLSVSAGWPSKLASQASTHLYRILEESLNNARMHSGARAVEVALKVTSSGWMALEVRDDGHGIARPDAREGMGFGLLGIKERAMILGGAIRIETPAEGGTEIRATFPRENLI